MIPPSKRTGNVHKGMVSCQTRVRALRARAMNEEIRDFRIFQVYSTQNEYT
jgi:hypothetical protein